MNIVDLFFENSSIFISVLNKSFIASYVIIFVILIRIVLKKSPKIFSYLLWSVVAFRLAIPFSFNSVFSLLPKRINTTPIASDIAIQATPQINSGIVTVDNTVNESLTSVAPSIEFVSINPLQVYETLGMMIWVAGIIMLLSYSIISIVRLKKQLTDAHLVEDNIYEVSNLKTPFVFGMFKPLIYLPSSLTNEERTYIIKHEQIHIKRKDYLVKVFAFVLLTIYWFNPLVWIGFILMNKDMEYSCDERVLKELQIDTDVNMKKSYATSLVTLATEKKVFYGSPLAFGEGNVKGRVKNVLQYKKPKFWLVFISIIVLIVVLCGLFVNPKSKGEGTPLTSEEIQRFNQVIQKSNNEVLASMEIGSTKVDNPLAFFLTSYYEKPEEMDMGQFTFYIPRESYLTSVDQVEYQSLSEVNSLQWEDIEDVITPFGRIPYTTVEKYLNDYMNLSIDDMTNMGSATYSDKYKNFYSGASDVWKSNFVCTYGTRDGNIITLGNDFETLTVEKRGDNYYILSFLPVEFDVNASKKVKEVATQWANAYQTKVVENRYVLMTPEFQRTYKNQSIETNGEEKPWYLRDSSPWVDSYEIVQKSNSVVITYIMVNEISDQYIYQEELFLEEQDGKVLVYAYRVNVDNIPRYLYGQAVEIQKVVDSGGEPWRLIPENVVYEFALNDLGYSSGKVISKSYYEYIFKSDKGDEVPITLYRPIRQDDTGFLAVKGYEVFNTDTNTNEFVDMTDSIFPNPADDLVTYEGKLGILLEEADVTSPYVVTLSEQQRMNVRVDLDYNIRLKKNDLVTVYDEGSDYYKVVCTDGETPYIHGEIKKSLVSFDDKLFVNANQGYLDKKVYYDKIDGKPMVDEASGGIIIEQRKDGWVSFKDLLSDSEFWVKEEDLSYNFPTTVKDFK